MNQQSDIWMLRISGEVIGPLSTGDLQDKIMALQVTGIDEVARPCASWYYLRDLDQFLPVLEKASMSRSATVSDSMSQTKTSQNTMTHTAQNTDSKTLDLVDVVRMESTQPIEDNDVVIGNRQNIEEEQKQKEVLNLDKLKESAGKKKKKETKLFRNLFVLVLFICIAGYYYKTNIMGAKKPAYANPFSEAQKNWKIGNFRQALVNMKAALSNKKSLKNLSMPYVALLIHQEGDSKKAAKLLEGMSNKNTAEWKNLSGMVKFQSQNLAGAEKDFLNSISADQFYTPAVINLGLIYRKRKNWSVSKAYFESAYSKGGETGLLAFLVAESWAKGALAKGDLKELSSVQIFLESQVSLSSSYAFELNTLLLWVKKLQGINTKENLDSILKVDPYLTDLRRENPFHVKVEFSDFKYICNDLSPSKNASTNWASVVALCRFMADEEKIAFTSIDEALKLNTGDANLLSLKSFGLDLKDNVQDASIALSEAIASNANQSKMLPLYMQAHFCQRRGDYKCSSRFWQQILAEDVQSASAYAALSRAYFEVGSKEKAISLKIKAGSLNPDLKSFIELDYLLK